MNAIQTSFFIVRVMIDLYSHVFILNGNVIEVSA